MPAPAAPETGPAPTPSRAVYGFLLYVSSVLAAVVYLTWALVPPRWLTALGLDYWPQQLWALTVPTTLLIALLLFVLVIYPLLGLVDAPGLGDPRIHTDEFSLPERPTAEGGIPPVSDIPLSEVCRHLYLDDSAATDWDQRLPSPGISLGGSVETEETRTGERRGDRPRRRQSERQWERETAGDAPRLRSWSVRDARPAEQRERGYGDVRWRSRGESWRVRRRRREEGGDGLSQDADSPGGRQLTYRECFRVIRTIEWFAGVGHLMR